MAETTDQNKPIIWKELVLGFAVVESCIYHSIRSIPIVTASSAEEVLFTDNLTRLTKLDSDESVTFKIRGAAFRVRVSRSRVSGLDRSS